MSVGLLVGEVGEGPYFFELDEFSFFVHSFFSTISYNLEPFGWGSSYPYLLKKLYYGKSLEGREIKKARKELKRIKKIFEVLPPNRIIWDIEDLTKKPPWGDNPGPKVTNLANYFITEYGVTFFEVFHEAFKDAEDTKSNVLIHSIDDSDEELYFRVMLR